MNRIFFVFLLMGCTVVEPHTLKPDRLTVEGQIQEGKFAEINLTNGLAFKGVIDSLEVARSIESKAKVVLSDGEVSEVLTLKRDDSRFPFLYYRSNLIKGELGRNYSLTVKIRGKEFLSQTTVPEKANVPGMEFIEWTEDGVKDPNSRSIKLTIANPQEGKNRYFKILIKKEVEENFEYAKPFIVNTENISTETFPVIVSYIKLGDEGKKVNQMTLGEVIELKIIAITKEQFDFWKSVKGDETSVLEGTSFTDRVSTNISNGAFGYWSGENTVSFKFKVE
ncbi:DUF4249 family protein [Tamlana crocina]|uniref:DUF4249 family protein n=1 Tax=Tamlana crocina TaxID=393006 RepID=A0ABX1DE50_9FLAO|nr:DUF4249 family protein [Tamlana crocina]NJX15652.1 DUF4249 family protein [Tamlana crocina]